MVQNWAQDPRCGLTCDEQRKRIIFLTAGSSCHHEDQDTADHHSQKGLFLAYGQLNVCLNLVSRRLPGSTKALSRLFSMVVPKCALTPKVSLNIYNKDFARSFFVNIGF